MRQAPEKLVHVATSPEHVCTVHEGNKILTMNIKEKKQNTVAADTGNQLLLSEEN